MNGYRILLHYSDTPSINLVKFSSTSDKVSDNIAKSRVFGHNQKGIHLTDLVKLYQRIRNSLLLIEFQVLPSVERESMPYASTSVAI